MVAAAWLKQKACFYCGAKATIEALGSAC